MKMTLKFGIAMALRLFCCAYFCHEWYNAHESRLYLKSYLFIYLMSRVAAFSRFRE